MANAKRKLAAILSADVVGYSRLMHDDEAATVTTLQEYRAAIGRVIDQHSGRIVNAPGDNILAEFPSAVEAVQAAVEIQRNIEGRNAELPEDRRMNFRVGVNLGDVLEEQDGTIYGDGVNIAARMEALADDGGICIASPVYDAVEGKIEFGFDFLGEQQVKNIAKPINVYRVRADSDAKVTRPEARPQARAGLRTALIAVAAVVVLMIAGVVVWQVTQPPPPGTETTAASGDTVVGLSTRPSIAVLPFTNLSDDPEQEYFSDGLTEDIITRLSRFSGFLVVARNSTSQYKGKAVDVREIGRELGARYVVEGSVRKAADAVRVTVQVLDATDGTHLWAETYDRELTAASLFEVQDEITERVAGIIGSSAGILWRAESEAITGKPTDSLDAYECVLRAHAYNDDLSPSGHFAVRDCLKRAVELDPNYSMAWFNLAQIYLDEFRYDYNPLPGAPLDRALEAAQRAAAVDPASAPAHLVVATAYFFRREFERFIAEAERAIELNPNDTEVIAELGIWMGYAGDWDRGMALVDRAIELNPQPPGWFFWLPYLKHYRDHDYAEALTYAQKIGMPDWYFAQAALAMTYGQLGRDLEARSALEDVLTLVPDFATTARDTFERRNIAPDLVDHLLEGLRKAGLDISDEPAAAD